MVFMRDQNKEVINLLKLNIEWCFKECNIKVTEFNIVSIRKISNTGIQYEIRSEHLTILIPRGTKIGSKEET